MQRLPTILVVDDDRSQLQLAEFGLEECAAAAGCQILKADSFQAALAVSAQHDNLLVVTDHNLGDGEGTRLAELLGQRASVMVVTASIEPDPARGIYGKPMDLDGQIAFFTDAITKWRAANPITV